MRSSLPVFFSRFSLSTSSSLLYPLSITHLTSLRRLRHLHTVTMSEITHPTIKGMYIFYLSPTLPRPQYSKLERYFQLRSI
jgi:hypothetical protein